MKKLAFYAFILTCGFLNMGAGCSKDDVEKAPEPEYISLIGTWDLTIGYVYVTDVIGSGWEKATQVKRGVTTYEFFSNGKMKIHDNTGYFPVQDGDWSLEVKNVVDKQIEFGILKFYTKDTRANPNTTFIEADGSIQFHISSDTAGGTDYIKMSTKAFDSSPRKFAYNEYIFERRK